MKLTETIKLSLYFLALINPVSKVMLLSSMEPKLQYRELQSISVRASIVSFFILFAVATIGRFVLQTIFHVDFYSLKIAGGIVLFFIGLTAVRKGMFFEKELGKPAVDISVVPLAAPLIVGPGIVTAAITFPLESGVWMTVFAIAAALLMNLFIMLMSSMLGRLFEKTMSTGPLIRITGLIVAAVSVQMILEGCGDWLKILFPTK
ncbi:MarC family protein [Lentisphaerota bacterium ZTH]|nr:MarC family protein [Lentisphaerota bacterium]WET07256.1 MarC family protein [Lentisphaerota bacterium ZTH]